MGRHIRLLIDGHVDAVERRLSGMHGRDMRCGLVEALRMRLHTANGYAIHALLHHACRKSHGLERVMSELGHMGCARGGCGCVHLWVLTLLHGILTHLISRCGGL